MQIVFTSDLALSFQGQGQVPAYRVLGGAIEFARRG